MKKSLIVFGIALGGCVAEPDFVKNPIKPVETTNQYGDFNFSTVSETKLNLSFTDAKGVPFAGIKIEVLDPETRTILFKGFTDKNGILQSPVNLPQNLDKVFLEAHYIGIPNMLLVPISNHEIKLAYAGDVNPAQILPYEVDNKLVNGRYVNARVAGEPIIKYASTYNSQGLPANLEKNLDYISATMLAYINASLPESQPVPTFHPTYLAEGKKTTLDIVEVADVWFTFVHEGAGWRNSLGFYTYPTNSPPQTLDDIKELTILFPNLSKVGSGGSLLSGHKVNLGRFQPGVSIGIVLLANGWDGSKVSGYYHKVFADKKLNPEPNNLLKQHNVLLWDEENKLFLLGFEDVRRDDIPFKCDQDFNDAIIFVSSNPVRAISTVNVSPVDKPGTLDRDGDGINDNLDEYPDDKDKAYDSYYPSATGFGSFAFEDNWPEMGDYDFNDLVVDYQFKHTLNSGNKVTNVESKFVFRAIGAGFRNGFGFEMNVSPSAIQSATGSFLGPNLIKNGANGTELNQSKAVFIVADNVHQLFGSSTFVNTQETGVKMNPKEVILKIRLANPTALAALGNAPYNPFLIISQDRGREVHLPGYSPTSLADRGYFGTGDDNTNLNLSRYYVSKTSLPWVIHLPESFEYPFEKSDIRSAHLRFGDWANSSGYSYMDWYRPQTGYRNTEKIFKK